MLGEWCYFKSYLNKKQCDDILKEAQKLPEKDSTIGVNEGNKLDTEYRRSKVRFIEQTNLTFKPLFDEIWKLAFRANTDWFKFHIERLSFIQLAEYDSKYSGEYKRHHDVFYINGDPYYHRKLTCVIQLTDSNEYEGGDFEVFNTAHYPNKEDLRQQGTVIFIPSFIEHCANPVTKGTRYSLASWIEGPKWR